MSDTYTEVSSPFKSLSDIGSPRADDHEYLELPGMPEDLYVEAALQAPPSPDYVPGPEEPEQAPPSPDYVPGPEYVNDEIVAEDQPGAEDHSQSLVGYYRRFIEGYYDSKKVAFDHLRDALSVIFGLSVTQGYVPVSDTEEVPEEDDVDPEVDPDDYPMIGMMMTRRRRKKKASK
ncbi:hypothetical protein Tco_1264359 [Tanacetum coccineum]